MAILAYDLGASSGRALLGRLIDNKLVVEELHRFANDPVQVGGRMYWDILRLFHEIKQGLLKAKNQGIELQSMAIDSWAVDFGLIGKNGELLGNPYHYRDSQTEGIMEDMVQKLGKEHLFRLTGLQFLPFNTIYQLAALKKANSPILEQADLLLMIPDLLRYFLTGQKKAEITNASTTQLLNPLTKQWDQELMQVLGLVPGILPEIVEAGTPIGVLSLQVCTELGVPSIPVIAVGEHDTASAVAAVPTAGSSFAYISCGTWSLLGTELPEPILSEQALAWNFTNEGGVYGTTRLLKNIMGLWIIQECKRAWDKEGKSFSFAELTDLAEQSQPFQNMINPDHLMFLNPVDMPKQIQQYCAETNQSVPQSEGEIIRCVVESLALKYRLILERTEQLTDQRFNGLHMVGGGINNKLLCQFTANAIGREVWAGPVEASAIGNLVVQYIALGLITDLKEARAIIKRSFPMQTYEPQERDLWEEAYASFRSLIGE